MASSWFLRVGVLSALAGMGLGIAMAMSEDHTLSPVHAHLNLIGWVTMFLAGLFYERRPARTARIARTHFVVAVIGLATLMPGITGVHLGFAWGVPLAAIGSLVTLASAAIFAVAVFRETAVTAARRIHAASASRV